MNVLPAPTRLPGSRLPGSRLLVSVLALSLVLAGCGGNGSSTLGPDPGPGLGPGTGLTPTPTPTPTPIGTCSLRTRQDWAAGELRAFYLFPDLLAANVNPASFSTVEDYIDALTAPARAQGRDRFFTFLTSIAEEDAFFDSGQTAAFGIQLETNSTARRVFVSDAYEGGPALVAGIDRGTEITAIGSTPDSLRTVSDIIAAEGEFGVSDALGPATAGTTRTLRIVPVGAVARTVTIAKTDFAIQPVSPRFGTQVLTDNGQRIGYVNLRTFISTADDQLRTAFARFQTEGVTRVIVDLRYNGGGLVSSGELLADLLGGGRSTSDVLGFTTFNTQQSASNRTRNFVRQPQSLPAQRIAFIGTGATASASELVINAFTPYLPRDMALVGSNTFGKPVGQIARDRAECDDRLRIVAFAVANASRQGDYYDGLATTVPAACRAEDTLARQMGDPTEDSTARALDFLANRGCAPITGTASTSAQRSTPPARTLLIPARPTVAQREVPGSF